MIVVSSFRALKIRTRIIGGVLGNSGRLPVILIIDSVEVELSSAIDSVLSDLELHAEKIPGTAVIAASLARNALRDGLFRPWMRKVYAQ